MMLRETPVKVVMVSPVISVRQDEAFSHVEEKMRQNRIRHLPVVDDQNKVVGIITQRDLYRAIRPHETEEGDYYDKTELDCLILKHYMTPNPMTLSPESALADAVQIMAERKYGAIPITSADKTLVGIISQIDILKHLAKWLRGE